MAVLPIVTHPDPRLEQVCEPVHQFDDTLRQLAADMLETMYDAKGRGLAAPQVGVLKRLFVMDIRWKDGAPEPVVVINPSIVDQSPATAVGVEACLSIPGRTFKVPRPIWVDMHWTSLSGIAQNWRLHGIGAVCVLHELDHLNGRLITETGTEE